MTSTQEEGLRHLRAQQQSQAAQRQQGQGHTDVLDVADARQIAIQRLGSVAGLAPGIGKVAGIISPQRGHSVRSRQIKHKMKY